METLSPEVLDDLRHGRVPRERKLAVCGAGGAHIPTPERVEILTVLSHDQDEMVAERAGEALLAQPRNFLWSLSSATMRCLLCFPTQARIWARIPP